MKDELDPGDLISVFVSAGPKNYAYKTKKGLIVIKVKGISLNFRNRQTITFDRMVDMVETHEEKKEYVTVNPHKIQRNKIFTRKEVKTYRMVYDKRVILPNQDTVPYGY